MDKKFKEMNEGAKDLGDKIWRKSFRNRNMGKKLQEWIYGREIAGGKLREWNCRSEIQGRQNIGSQILKTIKGERKGQLNGGDIKGRDDGF